MHDTLPYTGLKKEAIFLRIKDMFKKTLAFLWGIKKNNKKKNKELSCKVSVQLVVFLNMKICFNKSYCWARFPGMHFSFIQAWLFNLFHYKNRMNQIILLGRIWTIRIWTISTLSSWFLLAIMEEQGRCTADNKAAISAKTA